jgi:FkbM family methyltransferase
MRDDGRGVAFDPGVAQADAYRAVTMQRHNQRGGPVGDLVHFCKLSISYAVRPGSSRRLATVWGYLKITIADRLNLSCRALRILDWTVAFPSARELRQLYEEIILGGHYRLVPELTSARPWIIDGGANIGLSTLYFKSRYPDARIVCFEPHPLSFSYLRRNLDANSLADVEAHPVALGLRRAEATLYGNGLSASIDLHEGEDVAASGRAPLTVAMRPLSEFIGGGDEIGIVKLDIEGYEGPVLADIANSLQRIRRVVIEYHRWRGCCALSDILATFERNGHDYEIVYWGTDGGVPTCIVRTQLAGGVSEAPP